VAEPVDGAGGVAVAGTPPRCRSADYHRRWRRRPDLGVGLLGGGERGDYLP
jgi:hypothetical protein